MMKVYTFKNNSVVVDKAQNGNYIVKLYIGENLHDKITCDTYSQACDYKKSFCKIAKNK